MPESRSLVERYYVGIDPGASGGVAVVADDGRVTFLAFSTTTPKQVWDWLDLTIGVGGCFAVVEKVGGYVKGAHGNIGSAMFKFGHSAGMLDGFLTALRAPHEHVTPQKWQRGLGIAPRKKDEAKGKWKARLKAHAEKLFPAAKVTLATADALLIAEYCRRKRTGML